MVRWVHGPERRSQNVHAAIGGPVWQKLAVPGQRHEQAAADHVETAAESGQGGGAVDHGRQDEGTGDGGSVQEVHGRGAGQAASHVLEQDLQIAAPGAAGGGLGIGCGRAKCGRGKDVRDCH